MPLALKLVLLSVAATALVVGAAFVALRASVENNVRRVFASELQTSQQTLQQLQDRRRHLLLATSSLVATSPTLRAALQTWQVEAKSGAQHRSDLLATVQTELDGIYANL